MAHNWAGYRSQVSTLTLEGKTPLRMVCACPPYPSDVYTRGFTTLEQSPADPKALVVRVLQARRPVLDESAGVHVHP